MLAVGLSTNVVRLLQLESCGMWFYSGSLVVPGRFQSDDTLSQRSATLPKLLDT